MRSFRRVPDAAIPGRTYQRGGGENVRKMIARDRISNLAVVPKLESVDR